MIKLQKLLSFSTFILFCCSCTIKLQEESASIHNPYKTWETYLGDQGRTRFADLSQIDTSNVSQLVTAWIFHTGDSRSGNLSTIECNPIIVDGVMYVTSPRLKVVALDAKSGKEKWTFDPFAGEDPYGESQKFYQAVNRGVVYWQNGADQRIFFSAMDQLYALDANSGEPVVEFGSRGSISLKDGLAIDSLADQDVWATTPGTVYQNLLIVGTSLHEGPNRTAAGHVRAYNVITGKIEWTFHTIPQDGEAGTETWQNESWKTGSGANAWAGMSLDTERGLIFVATGSPSFDFYGGSRKGKNYYGNSVVALNTKSGELVWNYQIVHHDLWDYDLPCPPVLVSIRQEGKFQDAVAQVTKHGFVFVLDRDTGKPVFPVEERPVPASTLPEEEAYATQPFPVKPPAFVRQNFTDSLVSDISDSTTAFVRKNLQGKHYGQMFTPPSLEGTIIFPGLLGGANWSGASYDPATGWLYVNANEVPNILTLKKQEETAAYPFGHLGYHQFLDQEGYPAVKPPWGTLTAIDLNAGEQVWQIVLGEYAQLTERGIPPTGTPNIGGTIVTSGGLVFVAATQDEKIRAFNKRSGKLLWEAQLPFGGYATPSTYEVDGKQYLVIAAGGGGKMKTKSGGAYVTFTLPD